MSNGSSFSFAALRRKVEADRNMKIKNDHMPRKTAETHKICFECDAIAEHDHHIIPKSRGGKKTIPLCVKCHSKAHGKNMAHNRLTKDALKAKKLRKERIGQVPFGYRLAIDGIKLEPNQEQLKAVKLMKQMRSDGFTLREIAARMKQDGVLTAKGKCDWAHSSIQSVMGHRKK